jgi:predicted metalloprotease
MSRHLQAAAVAACLVVLVAGCSNLVAGKPHSVFDDPFRVAGMPATDGPSGLRPGASGPTRDVHGSDGGKEDALAAKSVSDVEQFWKSGYGEPLTGSFQPVGQLISWDANGYDAQFCGADTFGLVNAAFCPLDNAIGWDRGELLPQLRTGFGEMAVPMVLAHEYGHSIQRQAKLVGRQTPTLVSEQQADCFAGVYMRWVAEGKSPRFTLSTGDGLNNLLAAMISFRDPVPTENTIEVGSDAHGSAFERISAFQSGFTDGATACAGIDAKEIEQRRADLPPALQRNQMGEWPVSRESVNAIVEALTMLFSPANPPQLSFDAGSASSCSGARPSPPASYCPATNTIAIDLPGLQKLGTPSDGGGNTGLVSGDNTAYSVLTSRFMLAIEQQHGGLTMDNAEAGLRTACLTGVATTKLSQEVTTPDGNTIALTAGDLDEAVSGMLTNGLVAGDVNGEPVPSGFSRIDAFRTGVVGDQDRCIKRYP